MSDPATLSRWRGPRASRGPVRGSLRVRFVLAISALVAVVLVALVVVLVFTSRRELRRDIEQRAESHGLLAVRPICEAFESYYASGYSKFHELVTNVSALNPDLALVKLFDTSGALLFSSGELGEGISASARWKEPVLEGVDSRLLAAVKGPEPVSWSVRRGETTGFVVVVPYIEEWGRHRYSVLFEISFDSLDASTRALALRLAWLAAGSLLVGVAIAMLLARQSLGPLEQLIAGARDLGEGDLDRRLRLQTGDEFEDLARTFNQMAARLSSSIADLEKSNRALQQSNVELEGLNRFRSDLLANVSHELRTPLTSLRGYNEAMAEELLGPVTDSQREALEVEGRNIERLLGMIDELLSFGRLESKEIALDRRPTDLEEMVSTIAGSIRAARGPDLDLALVVDEELPLVDADPSRIAQVIDNLVSNAVKFTPSDGQIELRARQEGDHVRVEVEDTGIGIEAEEVGKIFDRFYQVESSSTRKYGGIGLGLAIVRQILDAHGSAIEVESTVGKGTRFRFRLPVAVANGEGRYDLRAVVIDDDVPFARALAAELEQEGFAVRVASNYDRAARLVEEFHPDLVSLDRLLPDGDGFDLLTKWRDEPETAEMPVVVVSIRQEDGLARRLGANGYLVKPIEPDVAARRIASYVTRVEGLAALLLDTGDTDLITLVTERLRRAGCSVTRATAWETVRDCDFGVVIVEVNALDPAVARGGIATAGLDERTPVVLVGRLSRDDRGHWEEQAGVTSFIMNGAMAERFAAKLVSVGTID